MRLFISPALIWLFGSLLFGCASKQPDSQTHVVEIKQMKFVPERINVSIGDSIKWVNKDIIAHDVAEKDNRLWQSEELQKGDGFAIKVNGESAYLCTIHPVMKGEVIIER